MRSIVSAVCASMAMAAFPGSAALACWQPPQPLTVEELGHVVENQQRHRARRTPALPQLLAVSGGGMKTAYAAGLLVGWGETGRRPDFAAVTGVGVSALLAPFAFLGSAQDARIAALFACEVASFEAMAERAAGFLDPATIEAIAAKHEAGGRLRVALPGSAARGESVWDLGAIAASRSPAAAEQIRGILLAAVDMTTVVDPKGMAVDVSAPVPRNRTFRQIGAGEAFLRADGFHPPLGATYLIHNGVLFPDESTRYAEQRSAATAEQRLRLRPLPVVPAYDFFLDAEISGGAVHIASPRPYLSIQPAADFDPAYLRALFLDAYRQGRMGREWRQTFPDRTRTYG